MCFLELFKKFVGCGEESSYEYITREGCHIAVGKFRMLDPDFTPSHILVDLQKQIEG